MTYPLSPDATLAIILGAHEWSMPQMVASQAFLTSAQKIRDYLLSSHFIHLPSEHLLDLFDDPRTGPDQVVVLGRWIAEKAVAAHERHSEIANVIIYYVGHGSFIGGDEYYLVVRGTEVDYEPQTGILVKSLADCIRKRTRHMRRFILLDCCFSGAASRIFQSSQLEIAVRQTIAVMPSRGTALLCSSSGEKPSLVSPDFTTTMFTGALHRALVKGDSKFGAKLSFQDLSDLTWENLERTYADEAIRPFCCGTDQLEGDLSKLPAFPNPAHRAAPSPGTEPGSRVGGAALPHLAAEVADPQAEGSYYPVDASANYIFNRDPLLLMQSSQTTYGVTLLNNVLLSGRIRPIISRYVDLHDREARNRFAEIAPVPPPPRADLTQAYAQARALRTELKLSSADKEDLQNVSMICDTAMTARRLIIKDHTDAVKGSNKRRQSKRRQSTLDRRLRIATVGFRVKISRLIGQGYLDEDLCASKEGGTARLIKHGEDKWGDTIEAHLKQALGRDSHIVVLPEFGLPPADPSMPERFQARLRAACELDSKHDYFVFAGSRDDGGHSRGLIFSRKDGVVCQGWWHYKLGYAKPFDHKGFRSDNDLFATYPLRLFGGNRETNLDVIVAIGYESFDPAVFLNLVLHTAYHQSNYEERIILVPSFNSSPEFVDFLRDVSFLAECPVVYVNGLHGDAKMFICGFSVSDLCDPQGTHLVTQLSTMVDAIERRLVEESHLYQARGWADPSHTRTHVEQAAVVALRYRLEQLNVLQVHLADLKSRGALEDIVTVEKCERCIGRDHQDDYHCKTDILYYNIDMDLVHALSGFRKGYFRDDRFLPAPFRAAQLEDAARRVEAAKLRRSGRAG
jgi:hypothetical protein